jgi:hypothetical protein
VIRSCVSWQAPRLRPEGHHHYSEAVWVGVAPTKSNFNCRTVSDGAFFLSFFLSITSDFVVLCCPGDG